MTVQDRGPVRMPWPEPPAPGGVQQIAPGALWLRLPLPMTLDHVNCYVFDDGDGWTLIDPGMDTRKTRALWQDLLDGPLAGKPVRRVIVTHHHPDHVGMAGWFQTRGAALWTTRTAWLFARMLVLDEQHQPLAETLDFWRAAGMDPALYDKRAAERPFNFADVVHPMPLGFRRIVEGEVFAMGGREWRVHMGDGHAPEHATFWSLSDDLVIGGDQLLPGISANLGVYATEPLADPVGEWLASCARFARIAEPRHLVLPGHKLPFTGLPLRLGQMIDNHLGALDRLRQHLAQGPCTAAQCFAPLFRRAIGEAEYGLALVEAVAHLNHLLHRDEVTRTRRAGDDAWLWGLA